MQLTSWNGVTLNGASPYRVQFGYGQHVPKKSSSNTRARAKRAPVLQSWGIEAVQQTFDVYPGQGYVPTADDLAAQTLWASLNTDLESLFVVGPLGTLTALLDPLDATTAVSIQARVVSFVRQQDNKWTGQFEFIDPFWESSASFSSSTNAGGVEVFPAITITTGTTATRYRVTITDLTGRGLWGYPVRVDLPVSPSPSQTLVYQRGRSVPFLVSGSALWLRVDVRPDEPCLIDIYTSSAINNDATANTLQLGQLDPTSTNTSWTFNSWDTSDAIAGCGVWQAGITAPIVQGHSYSFGVVSQDSSQITFGMKESITNVFDPNTLDPDDNTKLAPFDQHDPGYPNDADSIILIAGTEITGVSGITTSHELTLVSSSSDPNKPGKQYSTRLWQGIRTRVAGRYAWQQDSAHNAFTLPMPFTPPTGTVAIALGVAPILTAIGDTATFSGTCVVSLDKTPAVSVSGGIAARAVSGHISNGNGTGITLTTLLMDANTLTIDCDTQQITTASGPLYIGDVAFADPNRWLTLAAGANTLDDTLSASLSYHQRFGV